MASQRHGRAPRSGSPPFVIRLREGRTFADTGEISRFVAPSSPRNSLKRRARMHLRFKSDASEITIASTGGASSPRTAAPEAGLTNGRCKSDTLDSVKSSTASCSTGAVYLPPRPSIPPPREKESSPPRSPKESKTGGNFLDTTGESRARTETSVSEAEPTDRKVDRALENTEELLAKFRALSIFQNEIDFSDIDSNGGRSRMSTVDGKVEDCESPEVPEDSSPPDASPFDLKSAVDPELVGLLENIDEVNKLIKELALFGEQFQDLDIQAATESDFGEGGDCSSSLAKCLAHWPVIKELATLGRQLQTVDTAGVSSDASASIRQLALLEHTLRSLSSDCSSAVVQDSTSGTADSVSLAAGSALLSPQSIMDLPKSRSQSDSRSLSPTSPPFRETRQPLPVAAPWGSQPPRLNPEVMNLRTLVGSPPTYDRATISGPVQSRVIHQASMRATIPRRLSPAPGVDRCSTSGGFSQANTASLQQALRPTTSDLDGRSTCRGAASSGRSPTTRTPRPSSSFAETLHRNPRASLPCAPQTAYPSLGVSAQGSAVASQPRAVSNSPPRVSRESSIGRRPMNGILVPSSTLHSNFEMSVAGASRTPCTVHQAILTPPLPTSVRAPSPPTQAAQPPGLEALENPAGLTTALSTNLRVSPQAAPVVRRVSAGPACQRASRDDVTPRCGMREVLATAPVVPLTDAEKQMSKTYVWEAVTTYRLKAVN